MKEVFVMLSLEREVQKLKERITHLETQMHRIAEVAPQYVVEEISHFAFGEPFDREELLAWMKAELWKSPPRLPFYIVSVVFAGSSGVAFLIGS
ncbi:MAG: hypothetical protein ACE5GO_03360 [Anaerolineales bacterium]